MKTGLFFGSFNPIHVGHLILASYMVEYSDMDRVMFVVSPRSPFKEKSTLLNEYDRLALVRLAIEDDPRLEVTDIEFNLPKPSYTINTLTHLEEKYSKRTFSLIMGSDTVNSLYKWKNYEELIARHAIYVYPRPEYPVKPLDGADIKEMDAPLMRLSSSFIRESLKAGHSVRYMVPDTVLAEIDKSGFYQ